MTDHRAERIHAALRSLPVFRGLSAEDLERVQGIATLLDLQKGDPLWHAGDAADRFTQIVKGRVKVVRHGSSGDVLLEIFGENEPVGAVAVYSRIPYPASCFAMESTTLLCLPAREFLELMERHPEFARALIRELTRLNLALGRKLEEMRGQRVDARIGQLFLTLATRMGRQTAEGIEIPLALTRLEIAEMVGTTVESAIRVLSRWGREGVILTGDGRFVIPSRVRLEALVGGAAAE